MIVDKRRKYSEVELIFITMSPHFIHRKIEVHDADPNLFRQFLSYLYCGRLDTSAMTVEQLADMMALSDRYEVCV